MIKNEFIIRSLSAIIGVLILGYVINIGKIIFLLLLGLLNTVANWELYNAFKKIGIEIKIVYTIALNLFLLFFVYFLPNIQLIFFPFSIIIMMSFLTTLINNDKDNLTDIVFTLFSFIYTSVMFLHFLLLRNLENGIYYVWWVFATTWACDTFAYIVGMLYGKHKLIPRVSPQKSIEGSFGGLAGSIIASLIFANYFLPSVKLYDSIFLGILIGIFSQIGDLSCSLIKRFCKIKDFSRIIPGHGGVLDRFDSTLFSFPVAYYYIVIVIMKGGLKWF